jgi:hypothetical protein
MVPLKPVELPQVWLKADKNVSKFTLKPKHKECPSESGTDKFMQRII